MSKASVDIRPARSDDAQAIAHMVMKLAESTGHAHKVTSSAEDFLRHGFGDRPEFFGLIAERDATPCGMTLWFYEFSSWRGERGAYLQDIYVADELRGSGLGQRLLAMTAELAMADGATHLRLSVAADNDGARGFYDRLGFTYRDDECIYQLADERLRALAGRSRTP